MRRSVKKTTLEQFDLLKAEMAVHHAAARGYGVGANRAIVDAEWKDIVEKLNELGPPHRTMTEWKKVWSDVRLRMRKRFSEELMNEGNPKVARKYLKKPKKEKIETETEEDQLMDALNSSTSIYISQSGVINNGDYDDDEKHCITPHVQDEESQHDDYFDHQNPLDEEELNQDLRSNDNHYNTDYQRSSLDTSHHPQTAQHYNEDKLGLMEQTLFTLQNQMEQQNKLMQHLTQVTTKMSTILQKHVTALERKNRLQERQLKITEYHNIFLRRQEARKNSQNKCLGFNVHKS